MNGSNADHGDDENPAALAFVFYAMCLVGLRRHAGREPLPDEAVDVDPREMRRVKSWFAALLTLALVLSSRAGWPGLFAPFLLNFVAWTPLGFLLTAVALSRGSRASQIASNRTAEHPKSLWRRIVRRTGWGCGTLTVLFAALLGLLYVLVAFSIPKTYPIVEKPIAALDPADDLGGGLDGFDSPYIGHTGSWDGKGGGMFGGSKLPDLDKEAAMGLRWTFMCVYRSRVELVMVESRVSVTSTCFPLRHSPGGRRVMAERILPRHVL